MMISPSQPVGPLPLEEIANLSGLEILQSIMDGQLPVPHFGPSLGMWPEKAEKGCVTFKARPSQDYTNPLGTIHGGWIATLLDTTTAMAVQSTLAAGQAYATISLTTNLLCSVSPEEGELTCTASATFTGRRIASAEGRVENAAGKLVAHGVASLFISTLR